MTPLSARRLARDGPAWRNTTIAAEAWRKATGFPKAVLHSHNTLNYIQQCSIRHSGIGPDDVMLMPSPVTHITG